MSDSVRSESIPPVEDEDRNERLPAAPQRSQRRRRPEKGHQAFPFASADVLFGPSWRIESGS